MVSITDGDTIKVRINGRVEAVRFLLVDTPETNHPRLGEQPFGQEAKAFTKKMLEGKTVQLEKDVSDRDKYNRLSVLPLCRWKECTGRIAAKWIGKGCLCVCTKYEICRPLL